MSDAEDVVDASPRTLRGDEPAGPLTAMSEAEHALEHALEGATYSGTEAAIEDAMDRVRAARRREQAHGTDVVADGSGQPVGEHPGAGFAPDLPSLKFAREHVEHIHAGRKTATVRYGDAGETLSPGDGVELLTARSEPIKQVTVTGVAECDAIQARSVIDALDARYPTDTIHETIAGVNRHYDATIKADTPVRVIAWTDPEVRGDE